MCSNPWNLDVGSLALQRTWLGLEVYSKTMGTSMRNLFEKYTNFSHECTRSSLMEMYSHVDAIAKNPLVDIERVRNVRYLHEFDR